MCIRDRPKEVSIFNGKATDQQDLLLWFFIERYKEAYQAEIEDFIKNIWINRSDQYSQLRALGKTDKEKVEMYKIGG